MTLHLKEAQTLHKAQQPATGLQKAGLVFALAAGTALIAGGLQKILANPPPAASVTPTADCWKPISGMHH